ncbi:hypothetical protein, partial [Aquabacterium sp.]|uniref:hypothetical protein n=1 Tax=Aquabacterium sp. TaxID=1872578 RepID=UPI0025C2E5CB
QAASLKGKSWDQVRDVISRGESGTSASSVLGTSQGAALRMGQDAAGKSNASALIQAAASPTQNPRDIVTGLQQGAFAGTDAGFLNNRINQIVNSSKVNGQATITPSQAGVILQDALRVNNHSWGITNFLEGNSVRVNKNGDRLSQDYIDNEVARAKSGGLIQDAVRQGDVATGVQTLAQAQAARDAAQAQLVATRQRMVSQPGLQFQIPRLQAQLDAANAILIKAQGNVNTSAAPVVQPPAPKPGEPGSHWYDGLFTLHRN